jgi:hypothetical protein
MKTKWWGTKLKKKIKRKSNSNQKNEDQIEYEKQIKKWSKIKQIAIRRIQIKFDIKKSKSNAKGWN